MTAVADHTLPRRLRKALRRHGAVGVVRAAAQRVRQRTWIDETHVWYEAAPGDVPRPAELGAGRRLFAAGADQLDLLDRLPTFVTADEAARRLEDRDAELWLVTAQDEPVFCCWLFRRSTPVAGAPDGWVDLPAGFAIIEDVATAERHRGNGIASTALAMIARRVDEHSNQSVLAKVDHRNRASRRAFRKAGFRPVARMHRQERGPFTSVSVEAMPQRPSVAMLRKRLSR